MLAVGRGAGVVLWAGCRARLVSGGGLVSGDRLLRGAASLLVRLATATLPTLRMRMTVLRLGLGAGIGVGLGVRVGLLAGWAVDRVLAEWVVDSLSAEWVMDRVSAGCVVDRLFEEGVVVDLGGDEGEICKGEGGAGHDGLDGSTM